MKVEISRKKIAKLPSIMLGKETFERIGEAVSAGIVMNVRTSQQADGSSIKENAPSTIERKRKLRRLNPYTGAVSPLIDRLRRFIGVDATSWRWWPSEDRVRVEPASSELRALNRIVQERGYTGWFGIPNKVRDVIRRIVRARIEWLIKQAGQK